MESSIKNLPGAEIVQKGIKDLEEQKETKESLLVSIASPRLIQLGFKVLNPYPDAEKRLYRKLAINNSDTAHSQYNALIRRIVSFSRAYDHIM